MSKRTKRDASTAKVGAAPCTVTVCRGCCCGTPKVPGLDHAAQLTDLRTSLAAVATVRPVGCLDACEQANVIVVQPSAEGRKAGGRPVWLGLLQPGPCVLCAVADPSEAAPTPQTPGSLAETGRGLHIICALSDQWGYTAPSETGKVVWALFHSRLTPPSPARYPRRPGRDRLQNLATWQNQPA